MSGLASRARTFHLHRHFLRRPRHADVRDPAHADLQRDDAVPLRLRRAVAGDVRDDGRARCSSTSRRGCFPPERLHHRLAAAAVAFPDRDGAELPDAAEHSVPGARVGRSRSTRIAFTYVVIAVPFVVSGIAVCLALTGFPRAVSRLYAADLAGAALGCVLLIVRARLVRWSDGGAVGGGAGERSAALAFARARRLAAAATAPRSSLVSCWSPRRPATRCWSGSGTPVFRILYTKGSGTPSSRCRSTTSGTRTRASA